MKHQSLHNTSHIHQLRIINHQLFNEKMKNEKKDDISYITENIDSIEV